MQEVLALLQQADQATTADAKGAVFERAMIVLFSAIPGLEVIGHAIIDVHVAEEIDVALLCFDNPNGIYYVVAVPQILVECKCWNRRVRAAEIVTFANKMAQRDIKVGFFIAANGVTGDAQELTSAHNEISSQLAQGRRIIVISRAELEALQDHRDFVSLIKKKMGWLTTRRTSI